MNEQREPQEQSARLDRSQLFEGDMWDLPTDITLVDEAAESLEKRILEAGWDEDTATYCQLGFREAFVNAVVHGNLGIVAAENDDEKIYSIALRKQTQTVSDKRIHVQITAGADEVRVVIRDQGAGFDWSKVADPTSDDRPFKPSGRGLLLMRAFYDSVTYGDDGREITLVKRKPAAAK